MYSTHPFQCSMFFFFKSIVEFYIKEESKPMLNLCLKCICLVGTCGTITMYVREQQKEKLFSPSVIDVTFRKRRETHCMYVRSKEGKTSPESTNAYFSKQDDTAQLRTKRPIPRTKKKIV